MKRVFILPHILTELSTKSLLSAIITTYNHMNHTIRGENSVVHYIPMMFLVYNYWIIKIIPMYFFP